MKKYRKLVAAAVGLLAILVSPGVLGLAPGEELWGIGQDRVVQIVLALGTALGVWGMKNES